MTNSAPILFVTRDDDPDANAWLTTLRAALPEADILSFAAANNKQRQHCEVAIVAAADTDKLSSLPKLRWVQSLWAGVESLLACAALDEVLIVRMVNPELSQTMAEAVLAWTLYLHRDMPAYREAQSQRQWSPRPYTPASEKRVGVLGCGELGMTALARLHANGFQTLGWSRSPKHLPHSQHYQGTAGLETMLGLCDILVNLLPATEQTRHLLNADRLAQLPNGAALINFGRGSVVDDAALLDALDSGALVHAVLDVFEPEPLHADSRFWRHPSVTVLPHISAPTPMESAAAAASDNIRGFLQDGTVPPSLDRNKGY